jgi:copper chaperone CopZ
MEQIVKLRTSADDYDIRDAAKYAITVDSLIDVLSRCPSDAKVVFSNGDFTFAEVTPNSIRIVEVETYQEQADREEKEQKEEEKMDIQNCINNIKTAVNDNGGELILAMDGITLETCTEEQEENLIVTELITKFGGKLYGNTNWGVINLEETITDLDDWYTLEDVVNDL